MQSSELQPRTFVLIFFFSVIATPVILYTLNKLDLSNTNNDLIRKYQLSKLQNERNVETIIVGDSSAGNAIDAELFRKLSGEKTLNLALTGSFDFGGTFNMIRHASAGNGLKNVIIIQSLDTWERGAKVQAFFESLEGLDIPKSSRAYFHPRKKIYIDYLSFLVNPKEAYWFLEYLVRKGKPEIAISAQNDYFIQPEERYSNGKIEVAPSEKLKDEIDTDRQELLQVIDEFCLEKRLNCIYAHGPIHEDVYNNSKETVEKINRAIGEQSKIIVLANIFSYENKKMGNTIDHVDPDYKAESTKNYFSALKIFLK